MAKTVAKTEKPRKKRNELIGEVVSDKMNKTITVQVYSLVPHRRYGKYVRKSSMYKAHDEKNDAKAGDKVRIFETRPLSKSKRWMLAEVVERRRQLAEVKEG